MSTSLLSTIPKGIRMERRWPAKLFHKKSRTGCQLCRTRRVKCDEANPACSNCIRLELNCVYDRRKAANNPRSFRTSTSPDAPSSIARSALHLPETEGRRKLELELFYHYIAETGPSLVIDEVFRPFLESTICGLAFKSNAILYSMCLISALHRAEKSKPFDADSMSHCSAYLSMTLIEHRRDVAQLSTENIDFTCLTWSILHVYGFSRLQRRALEPYAPPTEWLRMAVSSHDVVRKAWALTKVDGNSIVSKVMSAISPLLEKKSNTQHCQSLLYLLRREQTHEFVEPWDEEARNAYKATLNCIEAIWKSINNREPVGNVYIKLIAFPIVVEKRFVDFVEERRPRALVILAHYFSLLVMLRRIWWIGDTGFSEVHAIAKEVPVEWLDLLRQPLEIIQDPTVFAEYYRKIPQI